MLMNSLDGNAPYHIVDIQQLAEFFWFYIAHIVVMLI